MFCGTQCLFVTGKAIAVPTVRIRTIGTSYVTQYNKYNTIKTYSLQYYNKNQADCALQSQKSERRQNRTSI